MRGHDLSLLESIEDGRSRVGGVLKEENGINIQNKMEDVGDYKNI